MKLASPTLVAAVASVVLAENIISPAADTPIAKETSSGSGQYLNADPYIRYMAPPSGAASQGAGLGLQKRDENVAGQSVGMRSDTNLGLNGDSLTLVYQNGRVEALGHGYLTLFQGYLRVSANTWDIVFTIDNGGLGYNGEQNWIICPSDGYTIKYGSDNCDDAIGVSLQVS